jgi:hypothetical protein
MRATVKVAPTNMVGISAFVGATFTVALMFAQIIYRKYFGRYFNPKGNCFLIKKTALY